MNDKDDTIKTLREMNRNQSGTIISQRSIIESQSVNLTKLRAANKKLRAELEDSRKVAKTTAFTHAVFLVEARAWREAHRRLAEAIGGKAK